MNLYQVIQAIEDTAAHQPPIASVVRNDVFRLNAFPDMRYGVLAWLQGEHRASGDGELMEWSFTLFYVDRLTADKGNEIEIQSTGISVLENVLRSLEAQGIFAGDYTFQTFNQRFTDECAGVFCRVIFQTAKDGLCEQTWEWPGDGDKTAPEWDAACQCWKRVTAERVIYIY